MRSTSIKIKEKMYIELAQNLINNIDRFYTAYGFLSLLFILSNNMRNLTFCLAIFCFYIYSFLLLSDFLSSSNTQRVAFSPARASIDQTTILGISSSPSQQEAADDDLKLVGGLP